ncbi:hypothetical protein DFJ77DRAFT_515789 [Powellomyces hirtus]|nr:hypothetical protein DFJ77DRAFT_515798 [Powellomyces hirtus]KAI8903253.1 hypothetical protein DFJ77DRAFT_515789 [Powellomyces hirtus]
MGWIGGYTLLIKGFTVDAYLKLVAPSVILWLEQSVNAWSDRPIKERASKPLEGRLNKTHIPDWGRPVGGPWEGFYSERRRSMKVWARRQSGDGPQTHTPDKDALYWGLKAPPAPTGSEGSSPY